MFRRFFSVLIGVVAGAMVTSAFEIVASEFHPLPKDFNMNDPMAVAAHAKSAPLIAFFIVLGGWTMAAFVAGLVSTALSKDKKKSYALICAILFIAFTIYNLYSIPSPIWFWIVGLILWIPMALVGRRIITG